jgi:hypothetical protein
LFAELVFDDLLYVFAGVQWNRTRVVCKTPECRFEDSVGKSLIAKRGVQ